jgi:hypothetical protein
VDEAGRLSASESAGENLLTEPALPHNPPLDQHDGHPEVVVGEELAVQVDIAELRLDTHRSEEFQRVITEMAAAACDELDPHEGEAYGAYGPPGMLQAGGL